MLIFIDIIKKYTKLGISYRTHNIKIHSDFFTEKNTIYLNVPNHDNENYIEIPIIDIFNSGQFELIAYKKPHTLINTKFNSNYLNNVLEKFDGLKIGTSFTLLKYLFIDLWLIKLLKHIKAISDSIYVKKNRFIRYIISIIRLNLINPFKCEYMGIFIEHNILKKLKQGNSLIYPYYPHMKYKKKNIRKKIKNKK